MRKTFPALRKTAYPLILSILTELQIPYHHDKGRHILTFRNGSQIHFSSLDDPEKIKSFNTDYIWMEEATDFTIDDFRILDLRCRLPNAPLNQIFLTFNPIDEFHWVNEELLNKRAIDCAAHHSTYLDNPTLPKSFIDTLEGLREQDENYYRIYTLGLFGRLEDLIYRNWVVVDRLPRYRYDCYGLDFGFTNPAALVGIVLFQGNVYAQELLYMTNLTNPELIAQLKKVIPNHAPIYADPEDPKAIKEISGAGFPIYKADNDVRDGIKRVKQRPLMITNNSQNLIAEIRAYKWRKDKQGRTLEDPVKFRDHSLDALRYACSYIVDNVQTVKTPLVDKRYTPQGNLPFGKKKIPGMS
jgi:phage terminase large subunit